MHIIQTDADLEAISDDALRELILERIAETSEYVDHFSKLVRFILLESVDEARTLEGEIGAGQRGADAFEEHSCFFEIVYVLSDDGSGVTVFINKEGMTESVAALCAACGALGANP